MKPDQNTDDPNTCNIGFTLMDEIDLTDILKHWPYEPGNVNVRLIKAHDSRPLIQLRIDLGILQMEVRNRPDGQTPHGFPSLLDFHLHQVQLAHSIQPSGNENDETEEEEEEEEEDDDARPGSIEENNENADEPTANTIGENEDADEDENEPPNQEVVFEINLHDDEDEDDDETEDRDPDSDSPRLYVIGDDDCRAIREEAVQYYHRYIAFYALDEFDAVFEDATHNLQLIDLCRHFAESQDDREAMEQLRVHTMMTRTRARTAANTAQGNTREAIASIDQGIAEITAFLESIGVSDDDFDEVGEIQVLKSMRDALIPKLPGSQKIELQNRLRAALDSENYELAAILRDEIRMMKD